MESGDRDASGRFEALNDRLHFDGAEIRVSPSAHLLGIALLHERGCIVPYEDLALILGSRSGDPANLVKVHVHDLRSCTGGAIPIATHRGTGLSWGRAERIRVLADEQRISFVGAELHVDGRNLPLTPLAARMTRYLWLRREQSHSAAEIVRAIGSNSRDPANILKVSMHAVRRVFRQYGLCCPIQSVRGVGARWSGIASLSEHDVAQADADEAHDHQPPR